MIIPSTCVAMNAVLLQVEKYDCYFFHLFTACFVKTEEWEKAATHAENV